MRSLLVSCQHQLLQHDDPIGVMMVGVGLIRGATIAMRCMQTDVCNDVFLVKRPSAHDDAAIALWMMQSNS